jgi:SAM-dependent methyltransferase
MFDISAELYDGIYTRMKNYADEAARVRDWILREKPDARTVLSVACGTAEHERYLKDRFEVDGIDLNAEFLRSARGKNPQGRYETADMMDFDLGRRYDAVICLFSSIGYVRTRDGLSRALSRMAAHLAPGGVLLVEPWLTPESWNPKQLPHLQTIEDAPELRVARMSELSSQATAEGPLSRVVFHYLIGTMEEVRRESEEHVLGLFTVDEMLEAHRVAGLETRHDPVGLFGRGLYVARKSL